MSAKPIVANAGKACTEMLDALGIPSSVFPIGDEITVFFRKSSDAIPDMTTKDMACVKREISLIVRNAKSMDAKQTARHERNELVKRMDDAIKKNESGKKRGTTLTISAPRKFDEFR